MVYCIVPRCNHTMKNICRFFGLPKEKKILRKWKKLLLFNQRDMKSLNERSKVCSCHFPNHEKANLPMIYNVTASKRINFDDSLIANKRKRKTLVVSEDAQNNVKRRALSDDDGKLADLMVQNDGIGTVSLEDGNKNNDDNTVQVRAEDWYEQIIILRIEPV